MITQIGKSKQVTTAFCGALETSAYGIAGVNMKGFYQPFH